MIIVFFHKVHSNTIFIKSTSPIRGAGLDLIFFIVQLVATGLYKYTLMESRMPIATNLAGLSKRRKDLFPIKRHSVNS